MLNDIIIIMDFYAISIVLKEKKKKRMKTKYSIKKNM